MADFIQAVVGKEKIEPDFFDGYKKQVLDAALTSHLIIVGVANL
jgi:hypothetical protein